MRWISWRTKRYVSSSYLFPYHTTSRHRLILLGWSQTDDVINYLREIMENDESDRVQAVLAMGFAKLMLSRMVTEDKARLSLHTYNILADSL